MGSGAAAARRRVPGAGSRRSSASRARSRASCAGASAGVFTLDELADLYDEGTGWCTDLAVEIAPDEPFAWDARVVADAAFGRYQRAATDFAGGRSDQLGLPYEACGSQTVSKPSRS